MKTEKSQQVHAFQESISLIKHKFMVMSSQVGVGKTSVIVNLAIAFSKRGLKVGLMDGNFHNPDIHRMLALKPANPNSSDKQFIPLPYSNDLKVTSIESVMEGLCENGNWKEPPKISDIQRFISAVYWDNIDYLFVDTPPGPGEELLTMIRAIPKAKTIIVTAPNKIGGHSAQNMINFFRKEKIPIFGWIENMQGFLCQHCSVRLELFSSGPGNRAVFLGDKPFLGRIPIDPRMVECANAGDLYHVKHPESEVAEACDLIIEKIIGSNKINLSKERNRATI
jgi:Mrp family chromosome partitioning ATPase